MPSVTVGEITREYPMGTPFGEIAAEFQPEVENDILLVKANGRLCELASGIRRNCTLEFITASDRIGFETYRRGALFMALKAIYDIGGKDSIKDVKVYFAVGSGLYMELKEGKKADEEFVAKVKKQMEALRDRDIPFYKRVVSTDEAVELFHRHKMYDKERLFRYRRASRVNIYSLDNFDDYFYGYMVKSTGYIKYFDVKLYGDGFFLEIPTRKNPTVVEPARDRRKFFDIQLSSEKWGERLGIHNIGSLNDAIAEGRTEQLILMQEALQEKRIGDIAEEIYKSGKQIVLIAGPSSSGKTSFSHRLSIQLSALGLKPHPIGTDNYFVDREKNPKDENGEYDYEAIECIDMEQFNTDINALLEGQRVELPRFNFVAGRREYKGDYMQIGKEDILVIEGIHSLNERLTYMLPKEKKYKIYISALTQLNIDEHNRIPTTDGRLIRRMIRDVRTRGHSAKDTLARWESVRRGEEKNIFPFQEDADAMFNSALLYEFAVLKPYAEALLFGIPEEAPEYLEAKRLLKFFDYVLTMPSEQIPHNSLLREFIGGSVFNV